MTTETTSQVQAPRTQRRALAKPDSVCAKAVDLAWEALAEVAEPGTVGEHRQVVASGERLVTHLFDCSAKGYRGWNWAVSVARAPRAKVATVCEVVLLSGEDAIQAPTHVPWEDRLRPGDLGAGDVLVRQEDDPRLVGGFEATGDEDVDAVAVDELGLGRVRVLSTMGRRDAADRWENGDFGPDSEMARGVSATCASCGFMLPVTGALRPVFGLCANEWSPADGRVVSLGYGCGAHSETDIERPADVHPQPVVNDFELDSVPREPAPEPDAEPATEAEPTTEAEPAAESDSAQQ